MNTIAEKTAEKTEGRRKKEEEMGKEEERKQKGEENDSAFSLLPSAFSTALPISIRSYTATDYPIVLDLWEQAKLRPFTEVEIERLLRSGGGALVAVRYESTGGNGESMAAGERVIGIVLWSHNGSIGILWRLAVAESARGQGIATRLLDRAEQDIREAGLSGVSLLTRVNNTVAKGMYARRGYRWNDHLEFWGKKLPAPLDLAEEAVSENAILEITERAGGQGSC